MVPYSSYIMWPNSNYKAELYINTGWYASLGLLLTIILTLKGRYVSGSSTFSGSRLVWHGLQAHFTTVIWGPGPSCVFKGLSSTWGSYHQCHVAMLICGKCLHTALWPHDLEIKYQFWLMAGLYFGRPSPLDNPHSTISMESGVTMKWKCGN